MGHGGTGGEPGAGKSTLPGAGFHRFKGTYVSKGEYDSKEGDFHRCQGCASHGEVRFSSTYPWTRPLSSYWALGCS